jgi:hypothetical protein
MDNTIYCFSKNIVCHHDDYFEVVNKIRPAKNIKSFKTKIKILLSRKKIVLMAIDHSDLIFFPLLVLRSLWGGKGIAISVSTEWLKNNRTFLQFFVNRGRFIYLRSIFNRTLFWIIKKFSTTSIYSIHKGTPDQDYFSKFVVGYFFDIQLWDVKTLNIEGSAPIELEKLEGDLNQYILFGGNFDERRSRIEFLDYLKTRPDKKFILACITTEEDAAILNSYPNIFLINRFITTEELFYLYYNTNVVYCFYTNQRPSGFFGRAFQMNKHIIVRENSYLATFFKEYKQLIPVSNLNELSIDTVLLTNPDDYIEKFDDSSLFRKIIINL